MKMNLNDMRTKAGHNLPELSTAPVVLPSPGRKKYLDVSDLYLHLVWTLTFQTDIEAFILAPVAVHSDVQGKGIGQRLINHGLSALRDKEVNIVLTYGDPRFYHKVGFHSILHETIRAPIELSQPEGWLGQSLVDDTIDALSGCCTCVKAWNNPVYW